MSAAEQAPSWQVVSGSPTPEELAAIVVVLGSAGGGSSAPASDQPRVGGWRSHVRTMRPALHPGPGAWKAAVRR